MAVVSDRLMLATPPALSCGVELELQAPEECRLRVNRESVGAMIDNLVDNAIKYSPSGSCVSISLIDEADAVTIEVLDQGPGIPSELHKKVFERFYRIPDQLQQGSGLGLAIVDRAAAQHGATVSLEPGPEGVGLRVRVRFPRSPGSGSAQLAG